MNNANIFTLDSFKDAIKANNDLKDTITDNVDDIREEEGLMTIHRENMMRYLEKYMCKDEEDLSDTLYFQHGIFLRIVD